MQARLKALALATLALPFVPSAAHAAESYDNCTGFIDSLPAVINTQGTWCLRKDVSTALSSGNAITINTNNVTIDCNDFKVGGLAAGLATQAYGIAAQERQNIAVRNCNVRGFYTGIWLQGAFGGGHVVERNRLSGNTTVGIYVEGDGSTVEHNWVLDTGGANPGNGNSILGIGGVGSVDVIDNLVAGVASANGTGQWATGIAVQNGVGASTTIRGNRVRGLFPDGSGLGVGIVSGDGFAVISDNQVEGRGHAFETAIYCNADDASIYRGNSIKGFGITTQRCVDGGGNVVIPVPAP
jgi:hypothetical protein